jgi:hypothetical protein
MSVKSYLKEYNECHNRLFEITKILNDRDRYAFMFTNQKLCSKCKKYLVMLDFDRSVKILVCDNCKIKIDTPLFHENHTQYFSMISHITIIVGYYDRDVRRCGLSLLLKKIDKLYRIFTKLKWLHIEFFMRRTKTQFIFTYLILSYKFFKNKRVRVLYDTRIKKEQHKHCIANVIKFII